jgi:hypothetical protein
MIAIKLDRSDAEDGCLSDLALDQLLTSENSGSLTEQARRTHLAQCAACTARLGELERDAADLLAARPHLAPSPGGPRARRAPRFIAGTLTLAAAAAAIALYRPATTPSEPAASDVRLKGSPIDVEVFARDANGRVTPLLAGGVAHAGDGLRFRLTAHRPGYAGLVSVDGAGRAMSYGPQGGRLVPLAVAAPALLDGSVVLDGVLGRERLFAFLCRDRLETDRLVRAVEAAVEARPPRSPSAADLGLDCALGTFWFTKVPAP